MEKMINKDYADTVQDMVNHPYHYEGSTSIECIDAMLVAFGSYNVFYFCLQNAFKYLWRHKNKNGLEDVKKAKWYLDYARYILEEANESDCIVLSYDDKENLKNLEILFDNAVYYYEEKSNRREELRHDD